MHKLNLPTTRYYGSKRKLVHKIWLQLELLDIKFNSVLDVFGGSASFAYFAKAQGKQVFYNDIFKFNYLIGKKLIEQSTNDLELEEALNLLKPQNNKIYKSIITSNYQGIYFNDEENKVLDTVVQNIENLESDNKKCSAYYYLFQACIMKRPYNLFHRNNLYMRENYISGNFGNKITWERTFEELFERFHKELNDYCFDNGLPNKSFNYSALTCPVKADLVYIDPPYFSKKTHTTYHDKYHFLEGLTHYHELEDSIDFSKIHKPVNINKSREFEDRDAFLTDLSKLIQLHENSHIVISYRSSGIPSIEEIASVVKSFGYYTHILDLGDYPYALRVNQSPNNEILIVGIHKIKL